MNFRINMSAGELFDLIGPTVVVASALISTWILISARRRFPFYRALLWAGAGIFLPLVVLPLYLAILVSRDEPKIDSIKGRFIIPATYLACLVVIITLVEYKNARSIDAHLARASFAKVNSNPQSAISEYREALKQEDNPHTHKLLAISLMDAGFLTEAITEFRAAESGGEPDDALHYYLAVLLEKSDRKDGSIVEYKKFLATKTCLDMDYRCESARQIVGYVDR